MLVSDRNSVVKYLDADLLSRLFVKCYDADWVFELDH